MSHKMLTASLVAGLWLVSATAQASFHTWDIAEIYSSADGSIQYIELVEVNGANNQHQLTNHEITSSDGNITIQYDFTTNLPDNQTANRNFLIATAGFASQAGAVTPDYIMPDGFLFLAGGTLNFAGVDVWAHGAMPTDGASSVFRNGSAGDNSPTNYAGQTGSLAAVPVPGAVWLLISGLGLLTRVHRAAA